MMSETKFFIVTIILWLIGATLSLTAICGIIWFALWAAKHFGII